MKNIYLNTGTLHEVFNELETSFDGVLNSSNNEFKLALDTDFIKGNIDAVTFINGITSFQVNMTFLDDMAISIESPSKSSILFAYCTEGYFKHSVGISGPQSTLRKHYSAIVTSTASVNTILHFKKNSVIQFSLIQVETAGLAHTINDPLLSHLKKTFLNNQSNFNYQGLQNLKITNKFSQMNSISDKGMSGHVQKKDIIQSILKMEIDNHTDTLIRLKSAIKRSALNHINDLKTKYSVIKNYAADSIYSKVITSKNRIFIK